MLRCEAVSALTCYRTRKYNSKNVKDSWITMQLCWIFCWANMVYVGVVFISIFVNKYIFYFFQECNNLSVLTVYYFMNIIYSIKPLIYWNIFSLLVLLNSFAAGHSHGIASLSYRVPPTPIGGPSQIHLYPANELLTSVASGCFYSPIAWTLWKVLAKHGF